MLKVPAAPAAGAGWWDCHLDHSKQYHIACLLDRLAASPDPPQPRDDDRSLSHWGMCDDTDSS